MSAGVELGAGECITDSDIVNVQGPVYCKIDPLSLSMVLLTPYIGT